MRKQFHLSRPTTPEASGLASHPTGDLDREIQTAQYDLSRRAFGQGALGSLLAYTLIETLAARDAFGDNIKPIATQWLGSVNELGKSLKGGAITQQQWQSKVEELLQRVELKDLMASLDMEKLMASVEFRERGEKSVRPKLPPCRRSKGFRRGTCSAIRCSRFGRGVRCRRTVTTTWRRCFW